MRFLLSIMCTLPLFLFGASPQAESFGRSEEEQVDLLIGSAQATLDKLQTLKKALQAFRAQEFICINSPDNNDQLYLLSQKALELRMALNQCHLNEYFRQSFLDEITQLSKQAEHPTLPSAKRNRS